MKSLVRGLLSLALLALLLSGPANAALVVIPITSGNDDAEEHLDTGSMDLTSSDLELSNEGPPDPQAVGVRFQSVELEQGWQILSASIQFTVDEVDSQLTNVRLYGELTPDAAEYAGSAFNITSRTPTASSVLWSAIPAWTTAGVAGPDQQTPDLTSIVQEIVNQPTWVPGNAMAIMIFPEPLNDTTGERTAESFNGSSSEAAVLTIDFLLPTLTWDNHSSTNNWNDANWDPVGPPHSPDETIAAVIGETTLPSPVNVASNASAYTLTMAGVADWSVVVVGADKRLDITTKLDAAAGFNLIQLDNNASLNTGRGSSGLSLLWTTGDATVETGGNFDVAFYEDGEGSGGVLTKRGGGTLTLGTEGAIGAALTTFAINGGTLALRGAGDAGGSPEIQFNASQLDLWGEVLQPSVPGLMGQFYNVSRGQPDLLNPLDSGNGVLTKVPNSTELLAEALNFRNNTMQGKFGVTASDYAAIWLGSITVGGASPLPAGVISFGVNSDDGSVIYIDLNGDGRFDPSTELILDDNSNHGFRDRTAERNIPAGTYDFLTGFYERGGGDGLTMRFAAGSGVGYGSQTILDPTDPGQAGIWNAVTRVVQPIDLTAAGTKFVVNADSTFNAITDFDALIPLLELNQGILEVKVTTKGAPGTVSFAQTEIPAGTTGTVGVDMQAPTDLGLVNFNNNDVTFVKRGPVDWAPQAGDLVDAGNATIEAGGGRTLLVGPDPTGAAGFTVNGGTLGFSSSGGDLAVANAVSVPGDGTVAAGQYGSGVAGIPESPITVSLNNLGSVDGTLGLQTTDDYKLNLPGPVAGTGGLDVAGDVTIGGTVDLGTLAVSAGTLDAGGAVTVGSMAVSGGTLDAGGAVTAGSMAVSGGTLNAAAGGTVDNVSVTGGAVNLGGDLNVQTVEVGARSTVNTGASQVVVSGNLQIGVYTYSTDASFAVTGANLGTARTLTLDIAGSTVTIAPPPPSPPRRVDSDHQP